MEVPNGKKELYVGAALADFIYARASADQALTLADINRQLSANLTIVTDAVVNAFPDAAAAYSQALSDGMVQSANNFFYSNTGFVGAIVQEGDKYTIVLRGSDGGSTMTTTDLQNALLNGDSGDGQIDGPDWHQNVLMGRGYLAERTQADDALALAKIAIELAGGDLSKVSVVGQSLGGGLAGIVTAVYGIEGIGIAPAPFGYQVMALAFKNMAEALGLPDYMGEEAFLLWRFNPLSPLPAWMSWIWR